MKKIQMSTPLVEMDGDEMTRILWQQIKEELLLPYVELKTVYFDLGLPEREKTADQVTVEAAEATKQYGVAVKCATITPNQQRVEEYQLTEMWKSPNGTIRSILDGTVFRAPIMVRGVSPVVKTWKKPITIARHAYGDVYKATEYRVPGPGVAELVFAGADGRDFRQTIYEFECAGVLQGQYNKDSSIVSMRAPVSSMPSTPGRTCGSPRRTPSPKSTTIPSRISSRRYLRRSTRPGSKRLASPIFTPSSTMRWPGSSAARAALSGPARTTTAM